MCIRKQHCDMDGGSKVHHQLSDQHLEKWFVAAFARFSRLMRDAMRTGEERVGLDRPQCVRRGLQPQHRVPRDFKLGSSRSYDEQTNAKLGPSLNLEFRLE